MPKIRVLVVDDAVVIRRLVSEAVTEDEELELAGWASNGKVALAKIPQVNPDCVTLDVEMPELDGIQTLIEIRKVYPRLPVIMFSTLTERGASKTLEALARGATDYVAKPANVGSVLECLERLRSDLIPKIKECARASYAGASPQVAPPALGRRVNSSSSNPVEPKIVCIASSTGGPNALSVVIPALPRDFPLPVVIAQHMPPMFTALFAKRLNEIAELAVYEAEQGAVLSAGCVYIAPGGKHLEVHKAGLQLSLRLTLDPPENSCRPAADVLFRSVVRQFNGAALGVVLSGMGQDGLRGCKALVEAGGQVIVQDQPTSVVWGMPGAVAQAGLAGQVLPLDQIAGAITSRVVKKAVLSDAR